MSVELDEPLFSQAAGWDVMKHARAIVEQGRVLSSYWAPPLLRGVVQTGEGSVRASLVIHGQASMENLCPCRDSRQWGKICVHVVAVGLHWLKSQNAENVAATSRSPNAGPSVKIPVKKTSELRREPDHWFWALIAITGEDPVAPKDRGKLQEMTDAWLACSWF